MAGNFKESNAYTILFSVIMVLVVGSSLAFLAVSLKPAISENQKAEKKQNILKSIGIDSEAKGVDEVYKKYITKEIAVNSKGEVVVEGEDAFNIDIAKEVKEPIETQRLPLYLAKNQKGEELFIIPLRGNGLWDAIWGYIALDKNLVSQGAVFDHKGETPGLGAEITQDYFQKEFVGEKVLNSKGVFVGINVSKTNADPKNVDKDDNEVDAISGATITSTGVSKMIKNRLALYMPYLMKNKN
ncbi:MAG: NADH:ubiquinone reductase (Na(+)-transporting) subunit C [Flavobacteriales bacterium]|nr:NADH:ubiquinone reductase (Na(+)-transporting) subunit C [Flavobacteriales bacterium]